MFLRDNDGKVLFPAGVATTGKDQSYKLKEFERDLDDRVHNIWERLKANQYKAPPVRRVEIPKGEGKTRPLA